MTPAEIGQHFVEHRKELLDAARKWLKTRYSGLREDAVQDAMVEALETPRVYPDLEELKHLVELRAFILFQRQRGIDAVHPPPHAWRQGGRRLVQYDMEGEPPLDPLDTLPDPGSSPEANVERILADERVIAKGRKLKRPGPKRSDPQELYRLLYLEGLTLTEAAQRLGISYSAVQKRSQRLVRKMRWVTKGAA